MKNPHSVSLDGSVDLLLLFDRPLLLLSSSDVYAHRLPSLERLLIHRANELSQYCPTQLCRFSINHYLNWTSLIWQWCWVDERKITAVSGNSWCNWRLLTVFHVFLSRSRDASNQCWLLQMSRQLVFDLCVEWRNRSCKLSSVFALSRQSTTSGFAQSVIDVYVQQTIAT